MVKQEFEFIQSCLDKTITKSNRFQVLASLALFVSGVALPTAVVYGYAFIASTPAYECRSSPDSEWKACSQKELC